MLPYTGLQSRQIRETIKIGHSGEEIMIRSPIDCQTTNVIYELYCKKDHENTNTPVGQHFRLPGDSHTDIQVTPFEKVKTRNPFVRKAREAYLIDKHELQTKVLNKKI